MAEEQRVDQLGGRGDGDRQVRTLGRWEVQGR
jgi:hypothetical protein